MAVFSKQEQHFLSSVANLGYGNPFLPERMTFEKAALGREFVPGFEVWSASVSDPDAASPNEASIYKKLSSLLEALAPRLAAAPDVRDEELAAYEDSVHYYLYQRYHSRFVAAQESVIAVEWIVLLCQGGAAPPGRREHAERRSNSTCIERRGPWMLHITWRAVPEPAPTDQE